MKSTVIPGTTLRVSRFIFGTGSLYQSGLPRYRRRLLHAAVDAGFTHFDTAPYYGFGLAESDLASVLRADASITFTTKVGLYPPGGDHPTTFGVFVRKSIGRIIGGLSRPIVDYSVLRARHTLETSLRRTRRQRVDVYLVHDLIPGLIATDEWLRWLESSAEAGKVKWFGYTATPVHLGSLLTAGVEFGSIIQARDSIDGREADILEKHGKSRQITYGYISAARQGRSAPDVPGLLRAALRCNRHGAIIVSTRRLSRLPMYAKLTEASENAD